MVAAAALNPAPLKGTICTHLSPVQVSCVCCGRVVQQAFTVQVPQLRILRHAIDLEARARGCAGEQPGAGRGRSGGGGGRGALGLGPRARRRRPGEHPVRLRAPGGAAGGAQTRPSLALRDSQRQEAQAAVLPGSGSGAAQALEEAPALSCFDSCVVRGLKTHPSARAAVRRWRGWSRSGGTRRRR